MRKKFIEVYDNILNSSLSDMIEEFIIGEKPRIPQYYTPNIAVRKSPSPGFGLNVFGFQEKTKQIEYFEPYTFLLQEILYRFSYHRNLIISQIDRIRVFTHLPSPNPGKDAIHTDSNDPHLVCLYYVNDSDGDTILFENDGETEIKKIAPKKNKIVFFDGSIKHCSSRPSKSTRSIINFNFHADFI